MENVPEYPDYNLNRLFSLAWWEGENAAVWLFAYRSTKW